MNAATVVEIIEKALEDNLNPFAPDALEKYELLDLARKVEAALNESGELAAAEHRDYDAGYENGRESMRDEVNEAQIEIDSIQSKLTGCERRFRELQQQLEQEQKP